MSRPDPFREIRLVALHSLRGANFWSRSPVTRLDVAVGAYDEISSAAVPGLTDALDRSLPGLVEHRCSLGERGGFLTRLRGGTYAPHIVEHVALELQAMIGDDVGFGRARGGDRPGEYTVVFEHLHEEVGRRAAALALDAVQHAFAGTLTPASIQSVVGELASLRDSPDVPELRQRVLCGITGGSERTAVRAELLRRGLGDGELIVDVPPSYILSAGLPYSRSDVAIIMGSELHDVPERYQKPGRARQLVTVLVDAVSPEGVVVIPGTEREIRRLLHDSGRRTAIFSTEEDVLPEEADDAFAVGTVRDGRILLWTGGAMEDAGEVRPDVPVASQIAAALAVLGAGTMPPASRL